MADIVQRHIADGDLVPGQPVPSEAEFEAEYGIARTTARHVCRELRARGLVHTIQGKGTFVGPAGIPLRRRRTPIYEEIAAEAARMIQDGRIKVNRRIPSEKLLMREYGVAKATVRHAVAFLRDQGWVFTVPYRGTYVSPPEKWPTAQGHGLPDE
ncbi:winged helix-turn-helix domain-containing protein [Streptosporangium longisporum]|uniref:winged helix-turn-helix domain-containing protein n=1 Tax=Streptosporangium longisporum TaxID=46187 RepID=UPI0031F02262